MSHYPTSERRTTLTRDPAGARSRAATQRDQRVPVIPPGLSQSPSSPDGSGSGAGVRSSRNRQFERRTVETRETIGLRTRSPSKEEVEEYASRRERENNRADSRLNRRKEPDGPWSPQVSLVPHTTAPLACRVTAPPTSAQYPSSLEPRPLKELSPNAQESAIIEDLLFVLMGFEGQYINFAEAFNPQVERDRLWGPKFKIRSGLDPSLRDLTAELLKVATHYSAVEAFVEVQSQEEFGSVNHALCAAVRKLLKEYLTFVTQLETQFLSEPAFTLQQMHLYTMQPGHMMAQLYSLTHEILKKNNLLDDDNDNSDDETDDIDNIIENLRDGGDIGLGGLSSRRICKGGSVLSLLAKRLSTMSGDPKARALLENLLREASIPYMHMLNEWLHHGDIKDPHGEFLVKEQKSIRRERLEEDYTDEYWEKRYTIRENNVPLQLEGVKDKVLLAGKYLNVVRECGGVDVSTDLKDVPRTFDDVRFLENVNSAYSHANSSLLNLLLTTHALPARLRSLKHYFFLDQSDFFSYFLELGTSELRKKPARLVNVGKLQSLLDLVLRQPGSVAAQDPFKEDVTVQMNPTGLTEWLMRVVNVSGLDQNDMPGSLDAFQTPAAPASKESEELSGFAALELDYMVPFPLSLVISRKTVLRYQLLFRYLLSLRHLETLLVNCWQEHGKSLSWRHKSSDPKLELWKRRAWTLRARMLVFVQQLLYFCTSEVIEPNWQSLMARLNTGDDSRPASQGQGSKEREPSRAVGRTVDELMQDHVDFLDTCLKECMLTNSKLLRIHAKLINTCTMFATYTAWLTRNLYAADPDLIGKAPASTSTPAAPATTYDPDKLQKLSTNLGKYEDSFSHHLRILLDALNYYAATETVVLLGLCARLSTASEGAGEAFSGGVGGAEGFAGEH